jgi:diguanylate cyclase (GGDEF)-like protein
MGVVVAIYELRHHEMTKLKRLNYICILITVAATLFELVYFLVFKQTAVIGMLSFVVYITATAVELLKESREMAIKAKESEMYHKLAYTDGLTGLKNRTAFLHDMDSRMKVNKEINEYSIDPTAIVMFDLNDLKLCNDKYGHDNGDKYIKMVCDELISVFGNDGNCYRIGGDEFCVITDNTDCSDIENKLESFKKSVKKLDEQHFVVSVSVAVGYAVYNSKRDKTLNDTLRFADAVMYENKLQLKQHRNGNE